MTHTPDAITPLPPLKCYPVLSKMEQVFVIITP